MFKALYEKMKYHGKFFELYMAARTLAWGIVLVSPSNAFNSSIAYRTMRDVAPESVWGIFALVIGTLLIVSNLFDSFTFRRVALFLIIIQWSIITIGFLIAGVITTALSVYPFDLIFSIWLFYKVGEQKYGR